eukprot:scpid104214/ scgid18286/ 
MIRHCRGIFFSSRFPNLCTKLALYPCYLFDIVVRGLRVIIRAHSIMAGLGNIPSFLCLLFILQSYDMTLKGVAATDGVPHTAVNGSANQVEPITPPPYNCLVQWLILAGA